MTRVHPSSTLGIALADIRLPDPDSREVRLGDLWSTQPVVLVHLRHFGCILCRGYAVSLREVHGDISRLGGRLVAIGTGGRQYAREFADSHDLPFTLLVDKYLRSHEVIGAKRGSPFGIFKPRTVAAAVEARRGGVRQGKTGPHPFVFGAAHVFDVGGRPRYAWVNDDYQDNAPVEELLASLDACSRLDTAS